MTFEKCKKNVNFSYLPTFLLIFNQSTIQLPTIFLLMNLIEGGYK